MIRQAIPFGTVGEATRFSVRGFLRASVRVTADDGGAGTIEIRRGYPDTHSAAYTVAQTVDINGDTPIDLVVDDCPELSVWVTVAGSGTFDVEWELDNPVADDVLAFYGSIGNGGPIQEIPNDTTKYDRVTVLAIRDSANTKGVVQLRGSLDPDGIATSLGTIDLDGTPTTFDVDPRSRLDVYVSTKNAGLSADFIVYRSRSAVQAGLAIPVNVALLDAMNTFTASNTFQSTTNLEGTTNLKDQKKLRLWDSTSGEYLGFKAPSSIGVGDGGFDYTLAIRPTTNGQLLASTTAGIMSWTDAPVATAGTSFPGSPTDGQQFYRTDIANPEMFHWDATRSKWLGELVTIGGGYASTIAAGVTRPLETAGDVYFSSSRGYLFPYDMTIVGCTLFSASTASTTVHWYEGSVDLGAILTVVAARGDSDFDVDLDFDGDNGWPHKYPQLKCTVGSPASVNNPAVMIHMRRRET